MNFKYTLLIFSIIYILLTLPSCTSEQELQIEDSEIEKLVSFVDEANSIAQQYDDFTGPIGSEIFGNNKAAVCGNEHDFIGPCIWAIDDIVEALGYTSIHEINKWMLDTGSLLYSIKQRNKDFAEQSDLVNEIACLVAPEILTRSEDSACYKENLVALLNGTLKGGISHTTNYADNSHLTENQMYEVGSSFYKIWRFMISSDKCN